MSTVLEEIHKIVERLPLTYQQRVLEFVQRLTQTDQTTVPLSFPTTPLPPGTPGSALLQVRFKFSREDFEAMKRALEDCERIEYGFALEQW
jgi:hypothetical protein